MEFKIRKIFQTGIKGVLISEVIKSYFDFAPKNSSKQKI